MVPLGYWLWLDRYKGSHELTILVLSVPIIFSYVIPALGMNWLEIWEFDTRFKIGRIRPHHGFLFGSATSLFALLCLPYPWEGSASLEAFRAGIVLGSVIAFWNWLYDLHAIRVGFIRVYNRPHFEGKGPEAIATDYAPVLFGTFGFCYGAFIRIAEACLIRGAPHPGAWVLWGIGLLVSLVVPVLAAITHGLIMNGETGLRTYKHRLRADPE